MKMNRHNTIQWVKTIFALLTVTGLLHATQAAETTSPSELLEKGVYSEETKGDLDAALQLYQQVVEQGKATQAVAAQAQYRLGVCYYKKKDFGKANSAFEKLVKDFPEQKELVASAQEYLSGAVSLMPAPWVDGEELRFDIKFASGFRIGTARYSAATGEAGGKKIWKLSSHLFAGVQQLSEVEVEADSFKPIHSRWKHTLIGDSDTTYSPGHAEVKLKGSDKPKQIELEGVIYDNEEAVQLMRRLPLAEKYSTSIKVLSGLGGGTMVPFKAEVAGVEKVEVPAGTFDAYRVELSIHQTFWYSTDEHRYLVKFEAGGVVAELAAINQVPPGQPVTYKDPELNVTFTAPAGWMFDHHEQADPMRTEKTFILDPEATAGMSVCFNQRISELKPEQQKSLRVWADADIADTASTLKNVKVRPNSWKERTVAGSPALGVIADFMEGKDKKTGYALYTFIGSNAVHFLTYSGPADFDAFLPKFESIIDSCK